MDIPWWGNCQMFFTMKLQQWKVCQFHQRISMMGFLQNRLKLMSGTFEKVSLPEKYVDPNPPSPHCCECGCYMLLCVNFIPNFYVCNWTNFSNFTFLFTILAWQSKTRENSSCHDLDNLLSTTLTSQVLNWVDTLFLGFL